MEECGECENMVTDKLSLEEKENTKLNLEMWYYFKHYTVVAMLNFSILSLHVDKLTGLL